MTTAVTEEAAHRGLPCSSGAESLGNVRIRFLGDFELTVNGSRVERWRAGKARALFQYLVIHRGQTLTRDRLYEALWPGSAGSAGGSSLKVAAHALRRVLDAHPDRPGESGMRLLYRDFGYVLDVADLWSDVDRFEELVHAGLRAAAGHDAELARIRLRAAVALYGGEFLRGESADWVAEQREYLRSLALRALVVLRTDAEAREDFVELIAICRRTLEIDRHHEETYRALMTAHGRRGELAGVRSWYELCARRLRDELAVAPAPETDRLLRAMIPAGRAAAGTAGGRTAGAGAAAAAMRTAAPLPPAAGSRAGRLRPVRRTRPDARAAGLARLAG